jgi:predicted lipoprotein
VNGFASDATPVLAVSVALSLSVVFAFSEAGLAVAEDSADEAAADADADPDALDSDALAALVAPVSAMRLSASAAVSQVTDVPAEFTRGSARQTVPLAQAETTIFPLTH